ncbi:MAG TPA: 3-deoxy-7-phosphoheptulonate synthase [Acidobacteriota bacterium]|nr:3-deoxy-7-phosphoheptulonate synthase [Acidobacteriota bacterium]
MILVLKNNCGAEEIGLVKGKAEELNLQAEIINGGSRTLLLLRGGDYSFDAREFLTLPCVERVVQLDRGAGLVSRETTPQPTVIRIDELSIGGGDVVVIAGPCAVESPEQTLAIAEVVRKGGAKIFRAGAFKPRTSPYSFQGLGEQGLKILADVRSETGLKIVTEAMDEASLGLVEKYADIIQIGSRNMQNYSLLQVAGRTGKPILLKRGMAATIDEWLMAAEYILNEGQDQVILCERGVRTFSDHSRFTLDLGAVPAVKELSHLPVIVDPSHGTGYRGRVPAMARAAIAAGADGLMIEVHNHPDEALSDGVQSLDPVGFTNLMHELRRLAEALEIRI